MTLLSYILERVLLIMTVKEYCNKCGWETEHDEDGCVYHQVVKYDSEGVPYFRYEEFNQDGEEW